MFCDTYPNRLRPRFSPGFGDLTGAVQKDFLKLSEYYGSTAWMRDYEADEAGKLPADLKRGVLSEDAVYDLLEDNHELAVRMLKTITKALENQSL